MDQSMNKIERKILKKEVLCALIVLGVTIIMVPLLIIGKYNHMSADDYWYALQPHLVWIETQNIGNVIVQAFEGMSNTWENWQGTYSSALMFGLTPSIFGEQYYFIVPYMMIGMVFLATFALFYLLYKIFLKSGFCIWVIVSSLTAFMQVEFMYSPASGLYWYNGSVHYVFMQGILYLGITCGGLFFYRCFIPYKSKIGQRIRLILFLLLASGFGFFAAGGNFSTGLLTMECYTIFLGAAIYIAYRYHKLAAAFLIPFLAVLSGFLLSTLAPGNANRQGSFQKSGVLQSILTSFGYSFTQALDWINPFVLLCLLLLLPLLLKVVSGLSFDFPFPLVPLMLSYCLYASMFTPGLYALGELPLSRNQNICKMFLLILLVINETYCLGWLLHKVDKIRKLVPVHGKNVWAWTGVLAGAGILFIVLFLRLDPVERKAKFVSWGAMELITTGLGELYHVEYLTRLNEYVNSEEMIIYVEPYTVHPYPLWTSQEEEPPGGSEAAWYGKWGIFFSEELME
jgi:hypothetical protein